MHRSEEDSVGEGDQSIDNHSERHCTPSGTLLGIGCGVMYLCGHTLGPAVPEEDVVPETSAVRTWNFAKRLMTETFSNSWCSSLKSNIDAVLSNLHKQKECINTIVPLYGMH